MGGTLRSRSGNQLRKSSDLLRRKRTKLVEWLAGTAAVRKGSALLQQRWIRRLARLAGAAAGAVGVFALFSVHPGGPKAAALLKVSQYTLWRALVAGLTAIGIAVAPSIWALYHRLARLHDEVYGAVHPTATGRKPAARPRRVLWAWYGVLLVAITVGQAATTGLHPVVGWPGRSAALFATGLLIMAPAAVGILLATETLVQLRRLIAATAPPAEGQPRWDAEQACTVQRLNQLRTLTQRLLAALSAAVSAVTLSTGALRVALLAGPDPPVYPPAAPLLLGLFFSILVTLFYLPAAVNLQDACSDFANAVSPVPTKELSKTWSEDRQRVEKLLPTGDGAKDAIQTSTALLAPLLASLSGVLFK